MIDQIHTQIIMKLMQNGHRTLCLANYFSAYSYASHFILGVGYSYTRSSNVGRFGQIFWRIICPYVG